MKHADPYEMALSFQRGEREGFDYFFNTLYKPLLYFALKIVKDKEIAEDVVSESFIKIWKYHSIFQQHLVIRSWLYSTTKNACLNQLIQEKRLKKHIDNISTQTEYVQESTESRLIKAETFKELCQYIEQLPPEMKKIYLLLKEGLTIRQVSDELNISKSTAKNQLGRGLPILRAYFNGWKKPKKRANPKSSYYSRMTERNTLLVDDFKNRMTVDELAKKYNLKHQTVRIIVKPHRKSVLPVPDARKIKKSADKLMNDISNLREQGMLMKEIASALKISKSSDEKLYTAYRNNTVKCIQESHR